MVSLSIITELKTRMLYASCWDYAETGGDFGDSAELKPVRLCVSRQQKITAEERLMVRVAKPGIACLVKSCDTTMLRTCRFVKKSYRDFLQQLRCVF